MVLESSQLIGVSDWNNIILWTTQGRCDNITDQQCTFNRGGAFDHTASSSFGPSADSNDTEVRPADSSSATVVALGADNVLLPQLNTTTHLENFTVFTPSDTDPPQSGVGLGRNSSLLNALYASGQIASKTWSLFWGLEGGSPAAQLDGNLVLGGYDIAKTTGANLTTGFLTDSGCPNSLVVYPNDITLNFKNGTNSSLFGASQGTAMRSCVKPDIPLITFPSNVWNSFTSLAGGNFVAPSESYKLWGMDFDTDGVFDGDMTFTLSSGLEITVPNSQLVVPDVTVSSSGQTQITNSNVREILVYNLEASNVTDMPLLGQVFLTSAYLHVDNDAEQFTLWQARPTNETRLIPVARGSPTCSNQTSTPSTSVAASPQAPKIAHHHGISTGAIVGIVLAVSTCTALVFGVVFWRRRKGSKQPPRESLSEEPLYNTYKEAVVEIAQVDDRALRGRMRQSAPRELAAGSVYEMPGTFPTVPEMST